MTDKLHIDALFAFIAQDKDGDESVCAFMTPHGWVPMVGADWKRVESLREHAQDLPAVSGKRIKLVKFSTREELEVIGPKGAA